MVQSKCQQPTLCISRVRHVAISYQRHLTCRFSASGCNLLAGGSTVSNYLGRGSANCRAPMRGLNPFSALPQDLRPGLLSVAPPGLLLGCPVLLLLRNLRHKTSLRHLLYHSDTSSGKSQFPCGAIRVAFPVPPPQSCPAVTATRAGSDERTRSCEWR
jgi:hypothetical protein